MAKVELPPNMESISGKLGNFIFRTYRKPNGTTETRVYRNPFCGQNNVRHEPTKAQIAQQQLFRQTNIEVSKRIANGDKRHRKVIFKEIYHALKLQPDGYLAST
jgi:hypothetical protein